MCLSILTFFDSNAADWQPVVMAACTRGNQVMQELVEHFASTPARVEQCVLHMDVANLVRRPCSAHLCKESEVFLMPEKRTS